MIEVLFLSSLLDAGELRSLASLAARLAVRGVAVRVLGPRAAAPVPEGLEVIEAPGLGVSWRRDWAVRRLPIGDEDRPDVLHVLGADMAEAGLATAEHWRLPYLLAIDEFLPTGSSLRLSRRWARGVMATDADLADELTRLYGVPAEWVEVIPDGIELPDLPPADPSADRIPVVGTSAVLERGSGLPILLEAARRLLDDGVDVEFVVDGQRRNESALRRLAAGMGVAHRVTFADDLGVGPAFWTVLNVFCRVSLIPHAGRMVGTALAHGIPAVVSDVPGLRGWILPGETGYVTPPHDAAAVAAAIRKLLDDPIRAMSYGLRAREWLAEHRDPEHQADALAAALHRALGKAGATEDRGRIASVG